MNQRPPPRNNNPRRQPPRDPRDPRKPQRPPLSAAERARRDAARREAERRRRAEEARQARIREREKAIRREEFREDLRIIGGRLLIFLIVLVVLTLLSFGVFLISFNRTPHAPATSGSVTYYYGGEEIRTAPTRHALAGKDVAFCFNDLADYLGMSETGTAAELKFILTKDGATPDTAAGDGTEESVLFRSGKTQCVINGQRIDLDLPNVLRDDEVWVSSRFITDYMTNLSFEYDARDRAVRIARIKDEEKSTDKETVYLTPSLKLKSAAPVDALPEDPLIGDVVYSSDAGDTDAIVLDFATDVSVYEAYMAPDGDLRDAFLVCINDDNPLPAGYTPQNPVDVAQISIITETQVLAEYAARALDALFQEMRAQEFYSMAVYKGYDAGAVDDHATGLAVDMDTLGCMTDAFQFEPEYRWLADNAWKFGFIERYPKSKTSVTGHAFEPYHYRFVGRYHAQKIHAAGITLEEYMELK